jgi:transposase
MKKDISVRREYAKMLFLRTNKEQKEICQIAGVSEKSLCKWKKEENWDRLKASIVITKEEQLRRIYQQISELNQAIENKDEGQRYASSSEADTLSKLAAAAKNLESDLSVADVIDVFMGFTDWLREVDLEKAKLVTELEDAYIKHRLNG